MSKFEATSAGIIQTGDTISSTIYFPAPIGNNNVLYKLPRTRCSGINIENWTSNYFEYPSTPYQVRQLANVALATNLNDEWFIIRKQDIPRTEQLNYDPVSYRFWTKLGFSETQLYNKFVGYEYDYNNRYIPMGTTDNLVDIADALITTKEPAENTPFFGTTEVYDTAPAREAKYEFSSIGALEFNNHFTGCGLPNTSGQPLSFRTNDTDITKFSSYNSSYNPDRERYNGYTFTTEGEPLVAKSLPIKTEFPYFLVMSDLVSTDFNVSANGGSSLNCVGVISKLNAEQDFYFQYQAPQSFYATKDTLISSITTEIRTPSLGIPPALSPYSSIIYQIVRYSPTPVISQPPVWYQQEQFYAQMNTLLNTINQQQEKTSNKDRFNDIMEEIADAVVKPKGNNSSLIESIIRNYDELNLKQFKNNPSGLRNFLTRNPQAENMMRDITTFNNIPPVGQQQQQIPTINITPPQADDDSDTFSTPINSIEIPPDEEDNMRWLMNNLHSQRPVDRRDFIDRYAFENKDAENKVGVELKTYKDKPQENATIVDMMRDKKAVFGSDVSSNLSLETEDTTPIERLSQLEDIKYQSDSGIGSKAPTYSSREGKAPTYSSGLSSIEE